MDIKDKIRDINDKIHKSHVIECEIVDDVKELLNFSMEQGVITKTSHRLYLLSIDPAQIFTEKEIKNNVKECVEEIKKGLKWN